MWSAEEISRLLSALERIATALEARNEKPPLPFGYTVPPYQV